MIGFFEAQALRLEGLSDDDIAALEKALPELEHLISVVQAEWPKLVPVVPVLLHIIQTIIQKQKELQA